MPRLFLFSLVFAVTIWAQEPLQLEFDREVTAEIMSSARQVPDGSFYQEFAFRTTAGTPIAITARSSAFDAFLDLGRYTADYKWVSLKTDDDSGGGRDARLLFTIPETGEYFVRMVTLNSNRTGRYTLVLSRAPQ